ncbi:uncharacterized protein BXZ73DRAFT_82581 [Epithele typhae]|uniref:uncharacterized protein n=1 Tax=Epithele typhae TaxID=378194 RepID=UPI0020087D39|nr:uncharacterized protein BXZ73DRAFT_82581 [Epithele typhae]KAH9911931.1 hypothetical protein BXZ73DRAFT_82581 [Epithele typhae]
MGKKQTMPPGAKKTKNSGPYNLPATRKKSGTIDSLLAMKYRLGIMKASLAFYNTAELPPVSTSSVVHTDEGVHNGDCGSASDGGASTTEILPATVPADTTSSDARSIIPAADGTATHSSEHSLDPDLSASQEEHHPTPASAAQEPNETAQEPAVVVDGNVKQDLMRLLAESCDVFNNSKGIRAGLADEINDCLAKLTDTQTLVSYLLADPPPHSDSLDPMDRVDEVMNRVPPFVWYLVDHITAASPECKIDGITQILYSYVLTPEDLCWVQVQATISRLEVVKRCGRGKRSKRGVTGGTTEDPPSLEERVVDPEGAEVVPPAASTSEDTISARPKHKYASGHVSCFVPDVLVSAVDGRGRRISVLLIVENKRIDNPLPQIMDYAKELPGEPDTVFIGVKIRDEGEGLQAIFLRCERNNHGDLEMVVIREDGKTGDFPEMVKDAYVRVHSRFFVQTLLNVLDRHRGHMQTHN